MKRDIRPDIIGLSQWLGTGEGGEALDTEWLGYAYQHWCQEARKERALVQTPKFVRDLILEKTLGEVLSRYGVRGVHLIDPACGCGFFLTDAFRTVFGAWMTMPAGEREALLAEAGPYDRGAPMEAVVAQVALDQIKGVDLDPVCVAISRMRLLFEAWRASDYRMPYRVNVFEGDALLHHRPRPDDEARFGPWPYDAELVRAVLRPGQYSAVVANPPYIRPPCPKLREAYRERYPTCYKQYSLAVPFMELIVGLAIRGRAQAQAKEHQGVLFHSIAEDAA